MRRLAIVLAALAFVVTIAPQPAECVWCSPVPCYGPCYGPACVCLVPPGTAGPGSCYGENRAAQLYADGWRVMP